MAATTTERELTPEFLDSIHESFTSDSKNLLAVNACVRNDVHEVLTAHSVTRGDTSHHTFSHVVSGECKAADQKSSGRCWIFACLGVIRRDIIKEHDLPADWELSQTHLFFWDKVERCNHFLEVMISTLDEDVDSRLQHHLLSDPINDGGQWDMLANLINKYGLVPKTAMPEAWTSCASRKLNWLLANKLREFASVFRTQCGVTDGEDTFAAKAARGHKVRTLKAEMMEELYRIICIHLGTPVTKFDWSVRSKDGKSFKRYTGLTPKTFAEKFVKFDVNDYVSVINDPRNEYGQMYTVAHLGNVVGGAPVRYLNAPIDVLRNLVADSIIDDKSVWFGCDVGKFFLRKEGILDTAVFDYDLVCGTSFHMDKATRLRYGESLMTHAMVFTGIDMDVTPAGTRNVHAFRVENSWGTTRTGKDGFLVMSSAWFDEFVYQIVVPKTALPDELQVVLASEPVVLPAWDPMGALARDPAADFASDDE